MVRLNRFITDTVWVALAQLFNSISLGIVILPALSKSYSSEIYGIWVQVRVIVMLLSPMFGLQFGICVIRYLSGKNDTSKIRQTLGSMLFAIIILSTVILVLASLLIDEISYFMFGNLDNDIYVWLTILWIFVTVIHNLLISYFYARHKIMFLSIRQIIVSIIVSGSVIILSTQGYNIELVMESVIILQITTTLIMFALIVKEIGFPYPNGSGLKSIVSSSISQMPNGMLLAIINFSDRFFITHFLGLVQTGIYSSSSALTGLITLIYFPISMVLSPLLSRLWHENRLGIMKSYLEFSTKIFLMLAIPATVGLTILSQPLLRLLTTKEFLAGRELVFLLSTCIIFVGLYQIEINVIYLLNRINNLLYICVAAVIFGMVLNIILIPRIGIIGAAISDVSVFAILASIVITWTGKSIGLIVDLKFLIKVILAAVLMAIYLNFININGIMDTVISIITSMTVFSLSLLLLRTFSEQDRLFFNNLVHELAIIYSRRR